MGPNFDASLAMGMEMEMSGFAEPDVREGLDNIVEQRAPKFSGTSPL